MAWEGAVIKGKMLANNTIVANIVVAFMVLLRLFLFWEKAHSSPARMWGEYHPA